MAKTIVNFDVDVATYVGTENAGVYYQVAEGRAGWYMTAVVDAEHFTETLVQDDGPYDSEAEAIEAGKSAAYGWCVVNNALPDGEQD